MEFQLLKLIIWPKSKEFAPQIVEFAPGKVNVITGVSRTGKSAIIPIIDYCFASSDCQIPIDTIRNYASWYGIVFQTGTEQILISRKVPEGNKVSNEFYLSRAKIVSIPTLIMEANEKEEGIKNILNTISSVPYFNLSGEEGKNSYDARLSFRDLMALVFQNQDIVANQNILFYKTHAHEHRERLRNWFPYILGAETIDILIARQRLQSVEKKLTILKRELEKAKAVSDAWMGNMLGHLKVAKEYGLLSENISNNSDPERLLIAAKNIIENIPDYSLTRLENIDDANKEIIELEVEEEYLSSEIGKLKKRLNDINRLKTSMIEYGDSIQKRVARLNISQWLENISNDSNSCPTCGSIDHPNAKNELKKISLVFRGYENQLKKVAEVPTSFAREEERAKNELDELLDKRNKNQNQFNLLLAKDRTAREEFQQKKNMFLFLGHLKSSMETFEKISDGGDFKNQIDTLEKEYQRLLKLTDNSGVRSRVEIATLKISQGMLKHLTTLDVESKYQKIAPKFVIRDLSIYVLSDDENWHILAEVGSASNWVSFHISLLCALHEYFLEQKSSCIPSFLIFDQPSQVYFPKLKKELKLTEEDPKYEDEDVEAVKNMFKTIANSVSAQKGAMQCIILDHADDSIYGGIEGIHEVDVWRNGKKLIPEEWYNK
jgi:hypothetical protein